MKIHLLGDFTITFTNSFISFKSSDYYLKIPNNLAITFRISWDFNHNNDILYYFIYVSVDSEQFNLVVNTNKQTIQSHYNELISLLESYSEPSILD